MEGLWDVEMHVASENVLAMLTWGYLNVYWDIVAFVLRYWARFLPFVRVPRMARLASVLGVRWKGRFLERPLLGAPSRLIISPSYTYCEWVSSRKQKITTDLVWQ